PLPPSPPPRSGEGGERQLPLPLSVSGRGWGGGVLSQIPPDRMSRRALGAGIGTGNGTDDHGTPVAVTTSLPLGLKATARTGRAKPRSVISSLPVATSQIHAVRSSLPETTRLPSVLMAIQVTAPACPDRVCAANRPRFLR